MVIPKVYVLNSFCCLIKLKQFKFSNFRIKLHVQTHF